MKRLKTPLLLIEKILKNPIILLMIFFSLNLVAGHLEYKWAKEDELILKGR